MTDQPGPVDRPASPDRPSPDRPGSGPGHPEPATYEAARAELVDLVRRLEAGGTTLEESLALWERAEQLATHCQRWLEGARRRLDEATGGQDG